MVFCENCGAKISSEAKFCEVCGTPVSTNAIKKSETQKIKPTKLDIRDVESQNKFCSNCGTTIGPEDKFCHSCGINVWSVGRVFHEQENASETLREEILGAQLLQKAGSWSFGGRAAKETLVITPDRLIIARILDRDWGESLGVIGIVYSDRVTHKKMKKKSSGLANMHPEEILKANENNYVIPNTDIQKIEIKKKNNFQIITNKNKYKWYIIPTEIGWTKSSLKEDIRKLEILLRPIFGDKLYVKT